MKLFSFDPKLGKEIAEFNSANAFINRIALTDSRLSVVCILLEPGGTLGLHPASENQLFLVVSGQGWVRSGETGRVPIRTFQAAFWQAGENHETGSDHGLVAVVVEGRDLQPHPYMKEVI